MNKESTVELNGEKITMIEHDNDTTDFRCYYWVPGHEQKWVLHNAYRLAGPNSLSTGESKEIWDNDGGINEHNRLQ
jgi:hypothetical protein